jgi:hypothetical protein
MIFDKKLHYVSRLVDLPKTAHFAVLLEETLHYPDPYEDTNCGGTRSTSHEYLQYIAFDDEATLQKWVESEVTSKFSQKKFRIIKVQPVEYSTTVSVHIPLERGTSF